MTIRLPIRLVCRPVEVIMSVQRRRRGQTTEKNDRKARSDRNISEIVRVLFVIDTVQLEDIAWSATGGISGEMARDLMITCLERRLP
jgi:hypothetical protein